MLPLQCQHGRQVGVLRGRGTTSTGSNFIADDIMDTLAHGRVTTMAAIELSLAGWWRRLDGGYVIVDQELIDALSHSPIRRRLAAACRRLWTILNSETVIPL